MNTKNKTPTIAKRFIILVPIDQAQRPPPETPGRLEKPLTNYPNRPTAKRSGGSLLRPGWTIWSPLLG